MRVARAVKKLVTDGQAFPNYTEWTVTKSWRAIAKVEQRALGAVVKKGLEAMAGERAETVAWSS